MSYPPKQPIVPTYHNPETTSFNRALVDAALITIGNGLVGLLANFPDKLPRSRTTLAEYRKHQRGYGYASMGIVALSDGFVLSRVSKSFLTDYSHRLKIPVDDQKLNYSRLAIHIDAQLVPPQDIDLTGETEIAQNNDAVISILAFERDVVHGALTDWSEYRNTFLGSS